MSSDLLLRLERISVRVPAVDEPPLVDDVSLGVARGESVGLVGESGSGKSLLLRSIIGLIPPPLHTAGQVLWSDRPGEPLLEMDRRAARGRDVSMIFQEPMRSLNPSKRVSWTLAEPLRMRRGLTGKALGERIISLLEDVGIDDPHRIARSYPHELSGGLQQRVMIAAALSTDPDLLLCDEPTTALDVTTQARILTLLKDLQRSRGLSLVFVSHDLAVIAEIADRVAVMNAGQLLEVGTAAEVIRAPQHTYTRMLVSSIPEQLNNGQVDRTEGYR